MSTRDEMPKELREKIPHDPRLYVRNLWNHPEDPTREYDFYDGEGEEFFYYLTDDDGPLNPENWGDIVVLLFARGCLKTTTATMVANWGLDCYPILEELVTAPRRDQTQEVMGRVIDAIEQSGLAAKRDGSGKKTHQRFRHDVDGDISYSEVKSRSSWGEGDALRGIHAHIGVVDEFQDVDEGMFSVFLETVDRSVPNVDYFPVIFVIGTPKMANSFFDRLWQMSDQKRWDDEANEWVQTTEATEYLPEEQREAKEELKEKIEILQHQEDEDDVDNTEHIETLQSKLDEISGFTVTGWHIDQYASPRHSDAEIAFKKAEYSKRKFKNEVEAQFYTPENDLLTRDYVVEAFNEEIGWFNRPMPEGGTVAMGVDWGGGDGEGAASTVLTVLQEKPNPEDGWMVLKHRYLPQDWHDSDEVEYIEEQIKNYEEHDKRVTVVVDEGYGDTNRSNLQDGVGTRYTDSGYDNVYGCMYGNVTDKEGVTWSRKGNRRYFTVHRTFMIESFVEDFRRGKFEIPADDLEFGNKNSNGTRMIDELTAPYTDRVETADGKKKLRVESDRNDDTMHSFVYAWIAANHVRSNRKVKRPTANAMY